LVSGSAHSYPVLGDPATIRVTHTQLPDAALEGIRRRWAALEDRFDLARPGSELSQVASGRTSVQHASAEFRAAHADAIRWRNDTAGYFRSHRVGGLLDLGGLAKAYAIRDAAVELSRAGLDAWLVELGGDAMSDALGSGGWTAGIGDPADEIQLLTAVPLGGSWTAVATARAGEQLDGVEFVQATVLGRDIVAARALATAVVAGGAAAFQLVVARWKVDVLAVDTSGGLRSTPRLGRHVKRGGSDGSVRLPAPRDSNPNHRSSIGIP
jgi:FAD:protein FMN transferase